MRCLKVPKTNICPRKSLKTFHRSIWYLHLWNMHMIFKACLNNYHYCMKLMGFVLISWAKSNTKILPGTAIQNWNHILKPDPWRGEIITFCSIKWCFLQTSLIWFLATSWPFLTFNFLCNAILGFFSGLLVFLLLYFLFTCIFPFQPLFFSPPPSNLIFFNSFWIVSVFIITQKLSHGLLAINNYCFPVAFLWIYSYLFHC